jgi:hypothetical protein
MRGLDNNKPFYIAQERRLILDIGNTIQWKPLNVITLGQTKSDNINRMITITGYFYLVSFSKWAYEM